MKGFFSMNIFFWFLIIAVITLALNLIAILQMKKRRTVHVLPVLSILVTGYLAAALLYLITSMQGTRILEQTQAAQLEIEPQSYRTAGDDTHSSYAFCSKEGMLFQFDDTELLTDQVPQSPSVVEIYFCQTRTGFSACYLYDSSTVRYILR